MTDLILMFLNLFMSTNDDLTSPWTYVKLVYWLWVYYLAVMSLKRANDAGTMPKPMKVCAWFVVIPAVLLDWLVNMLLSLVMVDPPAERIGGFTLLGLRVPNWFPKELVTGRLKRYAYDPLQAKWRREFALFMALLLDCVDPSGKHV